MNLRCYDCGRTICGRPYRRTVATSTTSAYLGNGQYANADTYSRVDLCLACVHEHRRIEYSRYCYIRNLIIVLPTVAFLIIAVPVIIGFITKTFVP